MVEKNNTNGADAVIETLYRAGVRICFANAGTTEIPLLLAMDRYPDIKTVLGLFEGVCAGAADGYGRMLEKPAVSLLHLGPGFANGIANLHNALRAGTPLFNIIGEHATWHIHADPPLAMDIEALAKTVSDWVHTNKSPDLLAQDTFDAIQTASSGKTASLIIPHNNQTADIKYIPPSPSAIYCEAIDTKAIEKIAKTMKSASKTAFFLGGKALRKRGLSIISRIQEATGCHLLTGTFPGYIDRGAGLPYIEKIPYFPEESKRLISQYELIIIAGAREPVTFFGYEGIDSYLISPGQKKVYLCHENQDMFYALECLADNLDSLKKSKTQDTPRPMLRPDDIRSNLPSGGLTPDKASHIIAAIQPEDAIIVDEGLTSFFAYYPLSANLSPHTLLTITGGAIGYGMPCSIGAAMACPERPVINVQADGSALYTVQALWTQAHESLNIKTLICSNRSYNILKIELARAGITSPGESAKSLIELDSPPIDWVRVAKGFGVDAVSVETASDLAQALKKALSEKGPYLIEMKLG